MDPLSVRAVGAAISVSRALGLKPDDEPEVLADGSNVLVHLKPAPVVARVATTTGLVRKPVQDWLTIDLNLARYLAAKNCPVVSPSTELPPGPHLHDGLALTFWEYVEHDRNYVASVREVARLLREMHATLSEYPGRLQWLSPFIEIEKWLNEMDPWSAFCSEDIAMVRRGYAGIAARIAMLDLPEQPLHGDAHKKNLLKTSRGLLWTDFEDACYGPIEWDVACFVRTSGEDSEMALASYGGHLDLHQLEPFFEARDLQGAVWGAILSTRFADRRGRAAEWMEVCRKRYR